MLFLSSDIWLKQLSTNALAICTLLDCQFPFNSIFHKTSLDPYSHQCLSYKPTPPIGVPFFRLLISPHPFPHVGHQATQPPQSPFSFKAKQQNNIESEIMLSKILRESAIISITNTSNKTHHHFLLLHHAHHHLPYIFQYRQPL